MGQLSPGAEATVAEAETSRGAAGRRSLPRFSPVWALNGLLLGALAATAAWVVPRIQPVDAPITVPWWALAIVFLLTEVYVVHLEVRKEAQSFSLAEVPLVVGLVFTGPIGLLAAELVGTGIALLHRRQSPIKLVFNVSQTALATCITMVVFHTVLGSAEPVSIRAWAAILLAVLAASTFSNVMIFLAITLTQGVPGNLPAFLSTSTLASLANAVVGLTAVALMWLYPPAAILVVSLVGILFLAYRALSAARKQSEELGALYAASHTVLQSTNLDVLVSRLLENARVMFKCELVEVVLLTPEGGAHRSRLSSDGTPVLFEPVVLDPGEGVWARVMAEQRPVSISSELTDRVAAHFAAQGVRDGLVAPLVDDGQVFGTLLVANRESSTRRFAQSDLELVETFANNVSVAIRNGRLIEELARQAADYEHLAHHDPLTELPNRTLFHRELREALEGRSDGERLAVVLLDLDRFKEVNDTLGHHNGDLVLQEFAQRLHAAVRPGTLLARLGGDEFGIVFTTAADTDSAIERAREIAREVSVPYSLGDLALDLRATMGVALCPEHGDEPASLLQRADVALYWAKDAHESAAVYSSDYDHYSADRLALAGELRRAIELQQLTLHYQPKVSVVTEAVVGVEALVRWAHPRRGLMQAGEFVELAERTGLIRSLTEYVLDRALRQARVWLDAGLELPVSVNLSTRDLENPELCREIQRLLDLHRVEAPLLELEVTESSMIRDPEHARVQLDELSRLGITLSVDDFGTGYSSLSYLARLPVHTLKIDRSFVQAMDVSSRDEAIVRSMIELGRSLGLAVVAEGVESADVIRRLRDFDCDQIQGYGICRPLPPDVLETWLRTRSIRHRRLSGDETHRDAAA